MNTPERILVRLPNWLGDAVLALPAVAAVRAAFPSAFLAVAAPPGIAPMFEELTGVEQQEILALEKQDETARLRAGAFDTILLLPNSFSSAWIAKRSGIRARWGYAARGRRALLTRAVARPKHAVHQAAYYAELVRGLGITVSDDAPRIRATERTQQRAAGVAAEAGSVEAGFSRPAVGFAPGAAYGHAKRWPPERVAQVITRLVRERGAACILVGAEGDREAGRAIESSLPADVRVKNLIGRTDLRLLIGVLARCSAFVSNDSGAMHLAAAAGVPVTAIFGPTNDKATRPIGDHDVLVREVFCRPCMLRECPIDHRCMKRISAEEVFASVVRRL
jgi:heptosyltransferase-2